MNSTPYLVCWAGCGHSLSKNSGLKQIQEMNSALKYGFIFLSMFGRLQVFGQSESLKTDTTDTSRAAVNGKFSGQLRYFFMATDNEKLLTDYYGHALSIHGKYETGKWKGLSLAGGAAAVFNLSSSNLAKIDSTTMRSNRYEAGLFDLRNPDKKASFRPEELYLQYTLPHGFLRVGRQAINTPFINPQDGRMRPTFVSGIYSKQSWPSTQLEGGWIGGVLPRSINDWYSVESSIGLNPQGLNSDGTPANYAGHLTSKGIFLAGISHTVTPGIKVKLWEQHVENIFNTALLQVDVEKTLKGEMNYLASLQYVHQMKVKDGGSSEAMKSYIQSGKPAHVISGMTGVRSDFFEASVNYTGILTNARYLMPREWGREPFFTFLPRERNEGFGDVQAFVIRTTYNFPKAGLKTSLHAGRFLLPDVKNASSNKYSMPSYDQFNVDVHYIPPFAAKINLQALYVYKAGRGNTYQNPAYVFNKVNMSLYNLMINYTW